MRVGDDHPDPAARGLRAAVPACAWRCGPGRAAGAPSTRRGRSTRRCRRWRRRTRGGSRRSTVPPRRRTIRRDSARITSHSRGSLPVSSASAGAAAPGVISASRTTAPSALLTTLCATTSTSPGDHPLRRGPLGEQRREVVPAWTSGMPERRRASPGARRRESLNDPELDAQSDRGGVPAACRRASPDPRGCRCPASARVPSPRCSRRRRLRRSTGDGRASRRPNDGEINCGGASSIALVPVPSPEIASVTPTPAAARTPRRGADPLPSRRAGRPSGRARRAPPPASIPRATAALIPARRVAVGRPPRARVTRERPRPAGPR